MKKHLHKILAGILVGVSVVSMTACSSSEDANLTDKGTSNQTVPMGRYVEESLELPKEVKSVMEWAISAEGSITIYGYDKDNKIAAYSLQEDNTWAEKDVAWMNQLERIIKIAFGENGETYVLYGDAEYRSHLAKETAEGTVEEVAIEWGETSGYPVEMEILPGGDIMIGRQNMGVSRFSGVDGKVVAQYNGSEGEFAIAKNQLMQVDMQRGGVVVFDLETGEELEVVAYDAIEWGSKLVSDGSSGTYVVNGKGVSRLAPGGSAWENIIEGSMSSFGMPSLYNQGVVMKSSEEFLVLFGSQTDGNELLRYTYNAQVPSRPTTELSVYMLEENMTVRQAAAEYQRQNPEVLINLQIGMGHGNSVTKSDAIRTLNTELLAGKGPDLLVLDGLPIQSYIDKGVLMDMGDWAGPKIEQGEWLSNITGAYEKEGQIYALPTRFKLPIMWGNQDIIDSVNTLEELAAWAVANPGRQVLYNMTPEQLVEKFYGTSALGWLDEEGKIQEEKFVVFLESIKTLADSEDAVVVGGEWFEIDSKSNEYLAYNDTQLHVQTIGGMMEVTNPYSAIKQRGEGDFDLAVSSEGGVFEPVGVIGVNGNSEHADIAKDIVKMAMSEQVQDVELGEGFAVNAKSFDTQAARNEGSMMAVGMQAAGSRPVETVMPDEKVYEKLASFGQLVEVPAMTDDVLMQMIIEETKGYFDGEKTAEEAATAVSQRTRAYLAE
ncbi:MAG: extracellular solute-binding protein [Cellulosilyticaceae bacterium]